MSYKKYFPQIFIICLFLIFSGSCSHNKNPVQISPSEPPPEPQQEKQVSQDTNKEEALSTIVEENQDVIPEQIPQHTEIEEKERDPSEILDEAFETYQDAQKAWETGNLDTALAALDEAYRLLLDLDIPQDSPLIQDKSDLRLLIARRIQEIYASRRTAVVNNHMSIPLDMNQYVQREIKSFQNRERNLFEASYKRSGMYRDMILEELKKEGLPEELSWMPMIESWFKVKAYSRARALGLWQFISSTGLRYGLKRDRYIDERMDPLKATQAAAKYLSELHELFGDWTTALAAYNCGEFRVQRVINSQREQYLDNFWDIFVLLPRETARFVPRFIATLLIINDPEKYGFQLPAPDPPQRYNTVKINRPVSLAALTKTIGLSSGGLDALNPELRFKSTPEYEYLLKVPQGYSEKTMASIDSVSRYIPPEATYVNHYVRRGQTVSEIASRYGTTVSAIARLNRLSRNYLIRPGQRLKVPSRGSGASGTPRSLTQEGEKLIYVVKRGDTLYNIAKSFNTTVSNIKRMNSLRSDLLSVGQKLTIQSGKPANATLYTVKRGDAPYKIAQRYGMNLSVFLNLNGLSTRSKIYPGQKLWVTPR
jgi:membrane-bound lytic murein transglycosylase D